MKTSTAVYSTDNDVCLRGFTHELFHEKRKVLDLELFLHTL